MMENGLRICNEKIETSKALCSLATTDSIIGTDEIPISIGSNEV